MRCGGGSCFGGMTAWRSSGSSWRWTRRRPGRSARMRAGLSLPDGPEGAVVLADLSFGPARPEEWARRAVAAFHEFGADCIVAETNQGGDMVKAVIAQEDADVPVRSVTARRGKWGAGRAGGGALCQRAGGASGRAGRRSRTKMCAFGADGPERGAFAGSGGCAGLGAERN